MGRIFDGSLGPCPNCGHGKEHHDDTMEHADDWDPCVDDRAEFECSVDGCDCIQPDTYYTW